MLIRKKEGKEGGVKEENMPVLFYKKLKNFKKGGDVTMETEIKLLERDHRLRNVGRWKSQGKTPLETSEGTQLS